MKLWTYEIPFIALGRVLQTFTNFEVQTLHRKDWPKSSKQTIWLIEVEPKHRHAEKTPRRNWSYALINFILRS